MIRPDYTARRAFQTPVNAPKPQATEQNTVACIAEYIASAQRMAVFFANVTRPQTRLIGYQDTAEMLEAAARRLREIKPGKLADSSSAKVPSARFDALPVPLCLAWKTWEAETFGEDSE